MEGADEAVQVTSSRAALPFSLRNHQLTFPRWEIHVQIQRLSRSATAKLWFQRGDQVGGRIHQGAARHGVKAGLKAEADPQIGKPTGYEKKIEFTLGQVGKRVGLQWYKSGSSGP